MVPVHGIIQQVVRLVTGIHLAMLKKVSGKHRARAANDHW